MDGVVALDVLPQHGRRRVHQRRRARTPAARSACPASSRVLRTRCANTFRWTPTVGTPYFDSRSTTWPETSGAQPGQVPTPMMAASPSALIRSHSSGSGMCWLRHRTTSVRIAGPVLLEPAVELRHEVVRVREADVDEEELLPLERVEAGAIPRALTFGGYPSGFRTLNMANSHLLGPRSMLLDRRSLPHSPALARRRRLADRDLLLAQVAGDQELAVGAAAPSRGRGGRSRRARARSRGRRSRARAGRAARRAARRSPCRARTGARPAAGASTITGASPSESSSSSSRRGRRASPRATASICCSPPERSPTRRVRSSPSFGKYSYARSSSRRSPR